jgi:hypothetical protein
MGRAVIAPRLADLVGTNRDREARYYLGPMMNAY